eukprot:TRINITY_DN10002_c0_g2_i6.p1 TRINITY_DN10002_c0_g2~~TRINITY_DN10002_c0_g2_i6.p1  ORF type:complete len:441 (-),score=160.18 TRINITY_DN10002_c0_g2_i6:169-1491(-)
MVMLNSSEILSKYCESIKSLKKSREERKKRLLEEITKLLNEDIDSFKEQYRQVKKNLKKVIGTLDSTAKEFLDEAERAKKLQNALEYNNNLADIIKGYEYCEEAEKDELKEEEKDHRIYEGQVVSLKGFQKRLDEVEAWFKKYCQSAADSENLLYSIVNSSSEIVYYDIKSQKSHKYKLKTIESIPFYCGVASAKGTVFLAGGTLDMVSYLDKVWSISIKTGEEKLLPELNVGRSENAVVVTRSYMVCIGGRNSEDFVADIELVNPLLDKKWKLAARLDPPRSFVSAVCCEECKAVYMFGGLGRVDDKLASVNCFSMLNLSNLAITDLIVSRPELKKLPELYSAGIVCVTGTHKEPENCSLIIFGGTDKNRREVNAVYSVAGSRIEVMKELGCEDSFYGQLPVFMDNTQIYAISKRRVHLYNVKDANASKTYALYEHLTL